MKQQRLALILTINDANTLKETKRAAYMSELGQSLFDTLDRAVRPSAPLLWAKLKRTCKQAIGQASERASERASGQLSERASDQASKQASELAGGQPSA